MSSSAAILASSGPAASVPTALTTTTTSTTSTTTTNPTTTITNQQQQQAQYRGIVKQVNSGDCVIIRSVNTKDGKNLEKQIMLSNITAPRLGRRSGGSTDNAVIEPDQPFAFEAREFLRKKTNRQRGAIYSRSSRVKHNGPWCPLFGQRRSIRRKHYRFIGGRWSR